MQLMKTLLNDDDELLSDCYNSGDDWHDAELENRIKFHKLFSML